MPRIRKKTSKRGTTAQRAKVKRKVAGSRKKSKKAANKDPTWKSKKAKDPGIPNNFPYKDQILAEIAEERRQTAEAKARRKEEKKNLRAQQKHVSEANGRGGGDDDDDDGGSGGQEDNDNAEGEDGHFDGLATLGGPMKSTSKSMSMSSSGVPLAIASAGAKDVAPLLLNPDLPHLAAVLDKADVVIEVLDARDPLAHRSSALEARVESKKGQKLLLLLNKIDTCPREPTAAWAARLRLEHPTLLFRVASSFLPPVVTHESTKGRGKNKEPLDDAWGYDAVAELLRSWAQEKTGDGPLCVAVVGLANSGKSAFINSLARKATLDVYVASSSSPNSPTTTPHALEVTLELNGKSVVFIDTPGLAWQPSEEGDREQRHAHNVLLRNKGRIDRLKDPTPAVACIVSRAETEDLMVFYGLPAFSEGDVDAFLMGIARAHGLIKKGGNPDVAAAARIVLRDWSTGKISRYAVPPAASNPRTATDADAVCPTLATIYAGDAALLERLFPRKEFRRTRDLVRLSSERIDDRGLALETPWFGTDAANDGSDLDVENEEDDAAEMEASGSRMDEEEGADEAGLVESADSHRLEGSVSGDEDEGNDNEDDDDSNGSDDDSENAGMDEEDEVPPTARSSSARKRKPPSLPRSDPVRPLKKVAFTGIMKKQVLPSNKRTGAPLAHSKRKKTASLPDLSATATTSPPKKANPGVRSTRAPAGSARTRAHKRAANAPTMTAQKHAAGEDGAYDFSKFF